MRVALTINERSTDEGHSPEMSGQLLQFWYFQQHSQLLFPYCSNKCHAAYEVFNVFHFSEFRYSAFYYIFFLDWVRFQ